MNHFATDWTYITHKKMKENTFKSTGSRGRWSLLWVVFCFLRGFKKKYKRLYFVIKYHYKPHKTASIKPSTTTKYWHTWVHEEETCLFSTLSRMVGAVETSIIVSNKEKKTCTPGHQRHDDRWRCFSSSLALDEECFYRWWLLGTLCHPGCYGSSHWATSTSASVWTLSNIKTMYIT